MGIVIGFSVLQLHCYGKLDPSSRRDRSMTSETVPLSNFIPDNN